ncbi:MFS transporter [Labedaea rhizosphaerae]|uniref:MFS transporter n=1 Tax=Labedaea rhizosphaerae TaxID=598644 RepID=A0A4R6RUE2_LABRH|nr:MFS transporter [Labedaea rhizosphaerae]TDP90532.1 MFS transporter [Labedaea rhizosphaerae]
MVAAVLTAGLALLLSRSLSNAGGVLVASRHRFALTEPVRLFLASSELRCSCLYQACVFAAFSAAWTTVPMLLTGPTLALSVQSVAAVGLVNAVPMVCTPLAGRLVDRVGPARVNTWCFTGTLAAALLLAVGTLPAVVAGMLLLDVTMQCGMVANQTRIYASTRGFRSRMNTAYMTTSYLAGAAGSWLGTVLYLHLGWPAVTAFIAAVVAVALGRHLRQPADNPVAGVR